MKEENKEEKLTPMQVTMRYAWLHVIAAVVAVGVILMIIL